MMKNNNGHVRVYQLANDLKISSKRLMEFMSKMGISDTFNLSLISMNNVNKIKWIFERILNNSKNNGKLNSKNVNSHISSKCKIPTPHGSMPCCQLTTRNIDQGMLDYPEIFREKFIIDGCNICRNYPQINGNFDMDILLTLLVEIIYRGGSYVASLMQMWSILLKSMRRFYSLVFQALKKSKKEFSMVTGGIQADEFILKRAETLNAKIISNDKFVSSSKPVNGQKKDYRKRFPWLNYEPERLIKGKVIEDGIIVPDLNIDVKINRNTEDMVKVLMSKA